MSFGRNSRVPKNLQTSTGRTVHEFDSRFLLSLFSAAEDCPIFGEELMIRDEDGTITKELLMTVSQAGFRSINRILSEAEWPEGKSELPICDRALVEMYHEGVLTEPLAESDLTARDNGPESKNSDGCAIDLENAEDEFEQLCRENARLRFGETVPDLIREQLEFELEWMRMYGQGSRYLLAAKLAERCRKKNMPYYFKNMASYSVMAWLAGFTSVKLETVYTHSTPEEREKRNDLYKSVNGRIPKAMTPALFKLDASGETEPFAMVVPDEKARGEIMLWLEEIYGQGRVYRVGKRDKMNIVRPADQFLILPKGGDIFNYTSLGYAPGTNYDRGMTVGLLWPFNDFSLFSVSCEPALSRLYELQQAAGEPAPEITDMSKDRSFIFREGIYQEIPILSEFSESAAFRIFRCSFDDLVKLLGIRQLKKSTADLLFAKEQKELQHIPVHREEIFHMLLDLGVDKNTASAMTTVLSYKDVEPFPTEEDFEELIERGMSPETVKWLKVRRALPWKSDDAELAAVLLKIVWFRMNRPDVFFA